MHEHVQPLLWCYTLWSRQHAVAFYSCHKHTRLHIYLTTITWFKEKKKEKLQTSGLKSFIHFYREAISLTCDISSRGDDATITTMGKKRKKEKKTVNTHFLLQSAWIWEVCTNLSSPSQKDDTNNQVKCLHSPLLGQQGRATGSSDSSQATSLTHSCSQWVDYFHQLSEQSAQKQHAARVHAVASGFFFFGNTTTC